MQWKKIDGFPNYSVSDDGQVRNDKSGRILKLHLNGSGYLQVGLSRNGKLYMRCVHKLVALAFIPNPENKPEANHKDGDKLNCKVANLEWMTHKENHLHKCRILGKKPSAESLARLHDICRKPVRCIETGVVYECADIAAKIVSRSVHTLRKALRGEIKTCGGLHWRYV